MDEMMLLDILKLNYGIDSPSLEFLREGGSHTYIVNGKIKDIELTKVVYREFLSGYVGYHKLSREEILSFPYWVAIRHFQLQATILEIYGVDCIDEGFIDGQLYWLNKWQDAIPGFTEELEEKNWQRNGI